MLEYDRILAQAGRKNKAEDAEKQVLQHFLRRENQRKVRTGIENAGEIAAFHCCRITGLYGPEGHFLKAPAGKARLDPT